MNDLQTMGDLALMRSKATPMSASKMTLAKIDKAAGDFEGMFMAQMLQPMFEGLGVNSTFGGGHGEEIMRGLLIQEYGKMAAKTNKLGIADAVKREMIKAQSLPPTLTTLKSGSYLNGA